MLLRGGVGRLRLVDFDMVSLSSLNRHAVATRADVGTPKSLALARHFREISPESEVDARVAMYEEAAEDALLGGWISNGQQPGQKPACVIDAIDNIDTKVALLAACHRRGIPVLCCAGAGAKADPTRLHIASLADSVRDPLARAVRHRLRRLHGRGVDVPVLFSSETPRCGLVPAEGDTAELQLLPGFRVRTIPVLGTTPAIFGCAAAAWALCTLAGQPFHGSPPLHLPPDAIATQLQRLCEREQLAFGGEEGVEVDAQDVAYVMSELWSCRSARHGWGKEEAGPPSNAPKAVFRSTAQLVLTRWDREQPASVDNLVLLTGAEAEAHDRDGIAAADPAWAAHVHATLRRSAREHGRHA